ncbi:HAD family hydrolase [Fulvivirga sedimenti]|uniref:HAD-IB family hydrolase n=1 Tax=Fulvivirga sedimenti TaxID=2879465 RepID=A0A9X1HXC5_9BACT|nr:HAD-IB family hydrolase [Fulvivirga sedimenti]
MKKLVLFDLDGTLTRSDTLLDFFKYVKGTLGYYIGMFIISPYLILYKLKLYPNWKAKEKALTYFLGGRTQEEVQVLGRQFAVEIIPELLRPRGLQKLNEHIEAGDTVVLVSASCEQWVEPLAHQWGVDSICTRLQVIDGKITGTIEGRNNYGPEKANRVREKFNLENYQEIIAYGDSRGDREMFELSTHHFYKPF